MRQGRRWILLAAAAVMVAAVAIGLWPAKDPYAFLRGFHPRESWPERLAPPFGQFPPADGGRFHVFEFESPFTFEDAEAIYKSHPGTFAAVYRGQLSDGPARREVTASLAAVEVSWLNRWVARLNALLRRP